MNTIPSRVAKLLWPWGVALLIAVAVSLVLAGVGASPAPGAAQGSVLLAQGEDGLAGHIADAASGVPVSGAIVSAAGVSVAADAAGDYRLPLPPGRYDVRVEALGYIGMTYPAEAVTSGRATQRDVQMIPSSPDEDARAQLTEALPRVAEAAGGEATKAPAVALGPITSVPQTIRVLMPDGTIQTMGMDDYLKGVVPFEIGAGSPAEAQKAQAVAARTYAATHCLPDSAGDPTRCEPGVDANVDTTTRTQVWRASPRYDASNAAVDATSGVVLRLNGVLASSTVYFGHTVDATLSNEDVFGGAPVSYLRSVTSPDPYNRLYGHGVGMSQVGAMVLADWGAGYADILRHYYTGLSVDRAVATPAPSAASAARLDPTPTPTAKGSNVLHREWDISGGDWAAGQSKGARVDGGRLQPEGTGATATYTTEALAADFEFHALSVLWEPPAPPGAPVGVEVRVSGDGKTWTPWRGVPLMEDGPVDVSDHASALHFETGRFAQVRLTLNPGKDGTAPTLDRVRIHYLNGEAGPTSAELATKAARSSKADSLQPPIVPREAWGATIDYVQWDLCSSRGRSDQTGYIRPNAFAVHHTDTNETNVDEAEWVRDTWTYHKDTLGWGDIGYHYVVGRSGIIYQGRTPGNPPPGYIAEGGHALQYNCGSAGIVALGNYQPNISVPLTPLTPQTRQGLVRITAWLMSVYGVRPWDQRFVYDKTVPGMCGHRDLLATQCPGDDLYSLLDGMRDDVQALLDGQVTDPTPTATPLPTDTPSPTNTPSPRPPEPLPATPVATPSLGPGCQSLIPQGDFTSYDRWTLNAAYVTQTSAHSAPMGLFLGRTQAQQDGPAWSSATSAAARIPTTLTRARLAFWYAPYSDGNDNDRFVVELRDGTGALLPNGRIVDDRPPHNYRGWAYFDRDVTSILKAATTGFVRVYLAVYNDGNGLKSYVRVDDITLEACAGPTPTPTPVPVTCSDWAVNGSFEDLQGSAPRAWTIQPSNLGVGISLGETLSTNNALRLGGAGEGFGYAAAWQEFIWPSGVMTATLSLSYNARGGAEGDTRIVELRDVASGQRSNLLRVSGAGDGTWRQASVPIAARPDGHPAQVYVAVTRNSASQPSLLVDNVSLRLCGRGLGGPYRVGLPHIVTEWDPPPPP